MGYFQKGNRKKKILKHTSKSRSNRRCLAKSITEVLSSGAWKDKTCFILGGGPSLKGFDFNLIKNYPTIGVNKSFIKFPTTINYAMDIRFYKSVTHVRGIEQTELHRQWLAYKGIKLFIRRSAKSNFDSSVYAVNNLPKRVLRLDLSEGIHSGNNSGFGALMLAIALGSKRIGLLGYDLKVQEVNKGIRTHWHEGYGFGRAGSFQSKLNKFRVCFEEFAPIIIEQGIEVINLNSDSALTCFPKDSIEDFLKKSAV